MSEDYVIKVNGIIFLHGLKKNNIQYAYCKKLILMTGHTTYGKRNREMTRILVEQKLIVRAQLFK